MQEELFKRGSKHFEPLSRNDEGPSTLARFFTHDQRNYLLSSFELEAQGLEKELKLIQQQYNDLQHKTPVLSHERLSGNPHSGWFDASIVAERLKKSFPDARIFIVVREQNSMILSLYFQYLKKGGSFSLNKYLGTKYDGKRPYFTPGPLRYSTLVNRYQSLFGRENVLVLPFELFRSSPADFLERLGTFTELQIDLNSLDIEAKTHQRSMEFATYHLRSLNRFAAKTSLNNYSPLGSSGGQWLTDSAVKILDGLTPGGLNRSMTNKMKKTIETWSGDQFKEDNQKLSELMGMDLSEFGYRQ